VYNIEKEVDTITNDNNELKKQPLGYVTAKTADNQDKLIPVYPMNDILSNYVYEKPENWSALKDLINIYLEAFIQLDKSQAGNTKLIEGNIKVRTQLEHYANLTALRPKAKQDLEVTSGENFRDLTLAEMQLSSWSVPVLEIRSLRYLGLVLSNLKEDENTATSINQIWFLGQNDPKISNGKPITNYTLMNPVEGEGYSIPINIVFVTLPLCRKEFTGAAKELADFLLGYDTTLTDKRVVNIAEMMKTELENFKQEKGLLPMLSVLEERDALVEMAQRQVIVEREKNAEAQAELRRERAEARKQKIEVAEAQKRVEASEKIIAELKAQLLASSNGEIQENSPKKKREHR